MSAAINVDTFRALIDTVGHINACIFDIQALQTAILQAAMQLVECTCARLLVLDTSERVLRFVASVEKDGTVLEERSVEQNGDRKSGSAGSFRK